MTLATPSYSHRLGAVKMAAALAFTFAFITLTSFASNAADIFVRNAHGSGFSGAQSDRVTDLVKNAVRGMPEHNLVLSETSADFVLDPTIVKGKNNQQVLRLRALQGQNVIASSEQILSRSTFSEEPFTNATRSTLQGIHTAENDTSVSNIGGRTVPSTRDTAGMDSLPARPDDSSDTIGGSSGDTFSGSTSSGSNISRNQSDRDSMSGGDSQSQEDETRSGATTGSDVGIRGGNLDATGGDTGITGGETRGTAPTVGRRRAGGGYFSLGAGPSFPIGLNSNNVQYGVTGAYNADFNERIGAKLFGNLNMGAGSDSSRFINAGAGANLYFPEASIAGGRPYLTADLGYGSARRNETEETKDAPTVGAGAGFQFAAQDMNLDVILHYSLLTADLAGSTPSVLALQVAVNF